MANRLLYPVIEGCEQPDLNIGDHIYARRAANVHSLHGIYVGNSEVIHYTEGFRKGDDCQIRSCSRPTTHGVIKSCLSCFRRAAGRNQLSTFLYSAPRDHCDRARAGTCAVAAACSNDEVVRTANYILDHGFGEYHLFRNNSEDFAVYCKTRLVKRADFDLLRGGLLHSPATSPLILQCAVTMALCLLVLDDGVDVGLQIWGAVATCILQFVLGSDVYSFTSASGVLLDVAARAANSFSAVSLVHFFVTDCVPLCQKPCSVGLFTVFVFDVFFFRVLWHSSPPGYLTTCLRWVLPVILSSLVFFNFAAARDCGSPCYMPSVLSVLMGGTVMVLYRAMPENNFDLVISRSIFVAGLLYLFAVQVFYDRYYKNKTWGFLDLLMPISLLPAAYVVYRNGRLFTEIGRGVDGVRIPVERLAKLRPHGGGLGGSRNHVAKFRDFVKEYIDSKQEAQRIRQFISSF